MGHAPTPPPPGDDELVTAARAGDGGAFAALVERHHGPLLRYLWRRTGDRELAADLAQDAFLDAFRHLDRLPPGRPFAPWLYRIAQHRLARAGRRARRRRAVSLDALPGPEGAAIPALQLPDGSGPTQERDLVQRALDGLSPAQREALLLHALLGFPAREVAAILGISTAAAQRRIGRATQRFRARYEALAEG
jgi:RNA polymerase sigma-70 factor (ECF subfamily)